MRITLCPCGSDIPRAPLYDARGIFLTFACDQCRAEKLREFRADVLTDPDYPAEEPIEGDDDLGDDPLGDWHGRNE